VNGKSAVEWVMERYAITTHKDSGIRNNPNVAVSVETVEIVEGLHVIETP
jgi:predicted helicase